MGTEMPDTLPHPIRVLVVEDEFLIRLTLSEALGDEGFEVLEAETGDAALPLLAPGSDVRLLLTDIQLPGSLNGLALVDRVRQSMPDLPVIYMTGRPDPDGAASASPPPSRSPAAPGRRSMCSSPSPTPWPTSAKPRSG